MKRVLFNKLKDWKQGGVRRKPLILEGARQVGKTYLLKEFGSTEFPAFHYINFEQEKKIASVFEADLKPQRILQELEFHLGRPIRKNEDLLIFDEIQSAPQALTSLKYFSEEMPELALCSAGSLLGLELNSVSFPVGKVDFLSLFPLSFEEFLLALEDHRSLEIIQNLSLKDPIPEIVHDHLWSCLKNYFVVGGLPESVSTFIESKESPFLAMENVRKIQHDLVLAYLADMAKHAGKRNSMHLERLLRHIPEQLAKNQDQSAPKFKFKDVIPGIQGYGRLVGPIDWLVKARLVIKTPFVNHAELPFSAYAKENAFKLYLFDVGLLGALSGISPKTLLEYDYGSYKGYFAENFVAQEFLAQGVPELYSWNEKTAEVEFLREIDGKIIPIEVNSGWVTQAKSLRAFADKYFPPFQIILSANNKHVDLARKTHRYPLYLAGRIPLKE